MNTLWFSRTENSSDAGVSGSLLTSPSPVSQTVSVLSSPSPISEHMSALLKVHQGVLISYSHGDGDNDATVIVTAGAESS